MVVSPNPPAPQAWTRSHGCGSPVPPKASFLPSTATARLSPQPCRALLAAADCVCAVGGRGGAGRGGGFRRSCRLGARAGADPAAGRSPRARRVGAVPRPSHVVVEGGCARRWGRSAGGLCPVVAVGGLGPGTWGSAGRGNTGEGGDATRRDLCGEPAPLSSVSAAEPRRAGGGGGRIAVLKPGKACRFPVPTGWMPRDGRGVASCRRPDWACLLPNAHCGGGSVGA